MAGAEIVRQGQLFAEAVLLGALFMLFYDGLRIVRRIFRHGMAAAAVEDLLFWMLCALGMFGFMYRKNEGVIRGFLIFGAAAGMILYAALASRFVVRAGAACFMRVLCALKRFSRAAFAPFWRMEQFFRAGMRRRFLRLGERTRSARKKNKAKKMSDKNENF